MEPHHHLCVASHQLWPKTSTAYFPGRLLPGSSPMVEATEVLAWMLVKVRPGEGGGTKRPHTILSQSRGLNSRNQRRSHGIKSGTQPGPGAPHTRFPAPRAQASDEADCT